MDSASIRIPTVKEHKIYLDLLDDCRDFEFTLDLAHCITLYFKNR